MFYYMRLKNKDKLNIHKLFNISSDTKSLNIEIV